MPKNSRSPFDPEVQEEVRERIRNLSTEDFRRLREWRPEGVPDTWPSLLDAPDEAPGPEPPNPNGHRPTKTILG